MKKLILLLLIMVTSVGVAQDRNQLDISPEMTAREITANMKSQLNLSMEQQERVYGLYLSYAKTKANKKGNNVLVNPMHREATQQEKESFKAEMRAVLTKEQYGRWLVSKNTL